MACSLALAADAELRTGLMTAEGQQGPSLLSSIYVAGAHWDGFAQIQRAAPGVDVDGKQSRPTVSIFEATWRVTPRWGVWGRTLNSRGPTEYGAGVSLRMGCK